MLTPTRLEFFEIFSSRPSIRVVYSEILALYHTKSPKSESLKYNCESKTSFSTASAGADVEPFHASIGA